MNVQVDLSLINIDTERSDFGDLQAALQSAVDANPDVTFRPASETQAMTDGLFQDEGTAGLTGTLIYTSPGDGASMTDLVLDIPVPDDGQIEDFEDYLIGLANASSSNGLEVGISPLNDETLTTIEDANVGPVASPGAVTTTSDTPIAVDFLANATDANGDALTLLGTPTLLDPSSGRLDLIGGEWVFTPADGFSGDAIISFVVQDPKGGSSMSTYTVTVDDLPIGAANGESVNIDLLTVEPSIPRDVTTADNALTREFVRPLTEAELVVLNAVEAMGALNGCLLYTSPSPRDQRGSRMPSSA